ncbi:ketoacyl-ACP synthase III [Helicobacter sp. MIT 05-5294]|uniref:3-oxoacyl-ACP synthase III family protein n=1 Tax=Helicobacter sp. MIT 05-5294 TaxID=1548150 RepID=UPI00051FDC4A|nr:ketoacyl-ACP synthase III [Helicobacter sp. MIT 05-5294]TLD88201.1 ketoacyl-ACP synthase III [Helicobacter sp. MIT 05-5294]
MVGIEEIAGYIPQGRISNDELAKQYKLEENFIREKIGVINHSVMGVDETAMDMCLNAFKNLQNKVNVENIDAVVVVTQNPDFKLPHLSAMLHKELEMSKSVACFDISLGCSGYVYGLSIMQSFMEANGFKRGLLFTADPYSRIVDKDDKDTSLLFGDGASVTLLSENAKFHSKRILFGTDGLAGWDSLICRNQKLEMNGRQVFSFAATEVPKQIQRLLEMEDMKIVDIDLFILHQGSRYIVKTIQKRLGVEESKVPYEIFDYGNTISSSIPLILANHLHNQNIKKVVLSGFGVGFSWASLVLIKE